MGFGPSCPTPRWQVCVLLFIYFIFTDFWYSLEVTIPCMHNHRCHDNMRQGWRRTTTTTTTTLRVDDHVDHHLAPSSNTTTTCQPLPPPFTSTTTYPWQSANTTCWMTMMGSRVDRGWGLELVPNPSQRYCYTTHAEHPCWCDFVFSVHSVPFFMFFFWHR